MKHKITDRQLVALLACYYHQRAIDQPYGVYGKAHERAGQPYWRAGTNMGGAAQRMADDLRDRDFVTSYNRYEEFGDKTSNQLTVLGFEALAERLDRLPKIKDVYGNVIYEFRIDPAELEERRARREEAEQKMQRLRLEKAVEARVQRQRWKRQAERKRLASLRALFNEHGLADNWADGQLIEFADKVAAL